MFCSMATTATTCRHIEYASRHRKAWQEDMIGSVEKPANSAEHGATEPDAAVMVYHSCAAVPCTPAAEALNTATAPCVPAGLPAVGGGGASGRRRSAGHAAQLTGKGKKATRHAEQDRRARGKERKESGRAGGGKRQGASRGAQPGAGANAAAGTPLALESDFPALCGDGYAPPPAREVEEAGRLWGEGAGVCGRGHAHEKMEQVPHCHCIDAFTLHTWTHLTHCASTRSSFGCQH